MRPGAPARDSGNYGPGAGAKPDGVVAVTVGLATLISGAVGGVVVVMVCSVAWGTGPTTCLGSAEPASPKITPSAPTATTALKPIAADPNFHWFACTLITPIGSVVYPGPLDIAQSQVVTLLCRGNHAAKDETRRERSQRARRGLRRRNGHPQRPEPAAAGRRRRLPLVTAGIAEAPGQEHPQRISQICLNEPSHYDSSDDNRDDSCVPGYAHDGALSLLNGLFCRVLAVWGSRERVPLAPLHSRSRRRLGSYARSEGGAVCASAVRGRSLS